MQARLQELEEKADLQQPHGEERLWVHPVVLPLGAHQVGFAACLLHENGGKPAGLGALEELLVHARDHEGHPQRLGVNGPVAQHVIDRGATEDDQDRLARLARREACASSVVEEESRAAHPFWGCVWMGWVHCTGHSIRPRGSRSRPLSRRGGQLGGCRQLQDSLRAAECFARIHAFLGRHRVGAHLAERQWPLVQLGGSDCRRTRITARCRHAHVAACVIRMQQPDRRPPPHQAWPEERLPRLACCICRLAAGDARCPRTAHARTKAINGGLDIGAHAGIRGHPVCYADGSVCHSCSYGSEVAHGLVRN
mmetsp:Transcript_15465/g.50491  ORF Transcript_15465/g.50491 Transcript_15465/m.50491 type:complete len:310 (-) Transcript_15465:74-1003(-)